MNKAIRLTGLILIFFNSAISAQQVRVMTHRFYFDTDISNRLKDEVAFNFTEADDGWLNGRIKQIKLIGYADCKGSTAHNLKLSEDRAHTIANAIKTLGVVGDEFFIECVGAGEQPCAGGAGDAGNRRVDLIMTYEEEPAPLPEESFVEMGEQMVESGRIK